MKSITLRTLLREPLKVKRWTRAGIAVSVTDKGDPLWVIHPPDGGADEKRRQEMEDEFAAILKEPMSPMPLSKVILESRR